MKPLKYHSLDSQTFAEVAKRQGGIVVTSLEDLTGKIPHVGYGGGEKSKYISPKTGKVVYVLERNGWYAGDAYGNDVWQFEADFTADEAADFIREWDTVHGLVGNFFGDCQSANLSPNAEQLKAWLWFTCPAYIRDETRQAIERDPRFTKS